MVALISKLYLLAQFIAIPLLQGGPILLPPLNFPMSKKPKSYAEKVIFSSRLSKFAFKFFCTVLPCHTTHRIPKDEVGRIIIDPSGKPFWYTTPYSHRSLAVCYSHSRAPKLVAAVAMGWEAGATAWEADTGWEGGTGGHLLLLEQGYLRRGENWV